jgi:hypothetical protein
VRPDSTLRARERACCPSLGPMGTDLDPRDLNEVRRRVVEPVINSLLKPGEFDDVALEIESQYIAPLGQTLDFLVVRIWACGELVTYWNPGIGDEMRDAEWMAGDLYEQLQEDLPETRFAWGERLRHGECTVPGPIGR